MVKGSAKILNVGPRSTTWSCPEPYLTCFVHSDNTNSPAPGQSIQLNIGGNWYDITLISATAPTPLPSTTSVPEFEVGTYAGLLE